MKKLYKTPIAFEEVFLANSYVAKCQTSITSKVTSTGMQCINPKHTYHKEGEYFSNVWVQGEVGSCAIVVDNESPLTDGRWTGILTKVFKPYANAVVYARDGGHECTVNIGSSYNPYYVPSFVTTEENGGQCYGAYRDKGITESIVGEPVFS